MAPSSTPTDEPASIPSLDSPRLHIGSGIQRLDDWLNVDIENLPGVDLALDIREGLPFDGVEAIFAEHFLEHLTLDEALDFLVEARRILRDGAGIRLSTPSLDWVVDNVYDSADDEDERLQGALRLNRAFHGWGHRFLWNRPLLAAALRATGFADLRWCRHGESDIELFRGLERHETYADTPELPHVLIVEARPGRPDVAALDALRERLASEFLDYVDAAE